MTQRFLHGKTAWITGGASGMGRAIALKLAEHGANVGLGSLLGNSELTSEGDALVYKPGQKELENTVEELRNFDVGVHAVNLDVTSLDSVQSFYDQMIEKFGHIDILVNAAGITTEQSVVGHSVELWQKVFNVNSHGPFYTSRLCLPSMMKKKWGRIINIASTAASVGSPTSAAYCASKAAVLGLSRCLALEGAEHGVTCNTISPGWVETSFGTSWMSHIAKTSENKNGKEYIKEIKADNPQKRMIQPKEIGALALYLCQNEAQGMTMQDLTVSAGSLW